MANPYDEVADQLGLGRVNPYEEIEDQFAQEGSAPAAIPTAADYSDIEDQIVQEEAEKNTHLATVFDLLRSQPDDAEAILRVSKATGAGYDNVKANYPAFKRAAEKMQFDPARFRREVPELYHLVMENPKLAGTVTKTEEVSKLARLLRGVSGWIAEHPAWSMGSNPYLSTVDLQTMNEEQTGRPATLESETLKVPEPRQGTYQVSPLAEMESGAAKAAAVAKDRWTRRSRQAEISDLQADALLLDTLADVEEAAEPSSLAAQRAKRRSQENRAEILRRQQALGPEPWYGATGSELLAMDIAEGAASQVQTLKGMGAGAAIGGGAAGAVALATSRSPAAAGQAALVGAKIAGTVGAAYTSFKQEAGSAYGEFQEQLDDQGRPMDPQVARGMALVYGAAAAAVEVAEMPLELQMFGPAGSALATGSIKPLLKQMMADPVRRSFFKKAADAFARGVARKGKGLAGEAGEEGLQQLLQFLSGYAGQSISAGTPQSFDAHKMLEQTLEASRKGAVGAVGISVAGDLTSAATAYATQLAASRRTAARVQAAAELADTSLARGDPAAAATLIERQTERTGEPLKTFHVDSVVLAGVLEQQGSHRDDVAKDLLGPEGPARMDAAMASAHEAPGQRATLEVSTEEWLRWKQTHPEIHAAIVPHTADGLGLLTPAEAEAEHQQSEESIKAAIERQLKELEESGPWIPSTPAESHFVESIRQQLGATGQADQQTVDTQVAIERAQVEVYAAKIGRPVDEVMAAYPTTVEATTGAKIKTAFERMTVEEQQNAYFLDRNTQLLNERGLRASPRDAERPFLAEWDLEGFKFVNDRFGHLSADGALRAMGAVLRQHIQDGAKIGGSLRGWVRDAAQAQEIAQAMQAALDGKLRVTTATTKEAVPEGMDLQQAIDLSSVEHKTFKGAEFAAGRLGHRKGAPAAFMKGAPVIAYEEGMRGKPLTHPKVVAALNAAAAQLEPVASGLARTVEQQPLTLGGEHRDLFAGIPTRQAFETIYREKETGLLTEDGFLQAQAINPTAFVASADLRAVREMDAAFEKEATDEIIRLFGQLMADAGGEDIQAAHLHGDEYAGGHDDRAMLDRVFSEVRKTTDKTVLYLVREDGSLVVQKGLQFAYGVGETFDLADRLALKRAKEEQGDVAKPEIVRPEERDATLEGLGRTGDRRLVDVAGLVEARRKERRRGAQGDARIRAAAAVNEAVAKADASGEPYGKALAQSLQDDSSALSKNLAVALSDAEALHQDAAPAEEILAQRTQRGARGFVKIQKAAAQKAFRIFVTEHADASTPIHELSHTWLEMLADLAERQDAPQQVRDDWEKAVAFLGVKNRAELTTEHKEKWARAFEAYVFEGSAPSLRLVEAFQRLRSWLLRIYKVISSLGVELDDGIRAVFDHLLATEEEIAEARTASAMDRPVLTGPEGEGVSAEQFAEYTRAHREDAAALDLRVAREVAEMRARVTDSEWRKEARRVRAEAEAEFDQRPDWRAWRLVKHGEQLARDGGQAATSDLGIGKLDRVAVRDLLGPDARRLETRLRGRIVKEGGEHPDSVAERFGYPTGKAMLDAVLTMPDRAAAVRARTEDLMRERHPELASERDRLAAAAQSALHAEGTAESLLKEWRLINTRAGGTGMAPKEVLQRAARELAGKGPAARIEPIRALANERREAERTVAAAAKGDFETARAHQERRILAHMLYRELDEARKERESFEELSKKLAKDKYRARLGKAGPAYRDVVDALLEAICMVEARPQAGPRLGVGELVQQMTDNGETIGFDTGDLAALIAQPKPWQEMTVAEMRGVHDALKNIKKAATNRNTVLVDGRRVAKEEVVNALVEEAKRALPQREGVPSSTAAMSLVQDGMSLVSGLDADYTRPGTMVSWLAGRDTESMWHRAILEPLRKAVGVRADLLKATIKPIVDAFEAIPRPMRSRMMEKIDGAEMFPTHRTDLKAPTRRFELLMLALNRGNASNIERLTEGRGISIEAVDRALSLLTRPELEWVQSVWDACQSLWGPAADLEEHDSGLRPRAIEAAPFVIQTRDGPVAMRGGYFPAVYDRRVTVAGERQAVNAIADLMDPSYTRPGTSKGHLKSRSKKFAEALSLDPTIIQSHLAQVAHDIAFRQAIKSVGGLILDPKVQQALNAHLGHERASLFLPWLRDVGQMRGPQTASHAKTMTRLIQRIRSNAILGIMGYRLKTAIGDVANAFVAAPWLRQHWFTGWSDFLRHPRKQWAFAAARSPWLRSQRSELQTEFNNQVSKLTRRGGLVGDALAFYRAHAFDIFDWTQKMTAAPMWLGAYRKAVGDGKTEEDAAYFADDFCVRFFPSETAVEKAAALRDQGFVGLSTMLFGYMNSTYNIYRDMLHDIYLAAHDSGGSAAKTWSVAKTTLKVAIMAWAFATVSSAFAELLTGRGPEEDEGGDEAERWARWYLRKLLMGPISSLPYASGLVERVMLGKKPSIRTAPVFSVADNLGKALWAAWNGDELENKQAFDMMQAAGALTGVPTWPLEPLEYAVDVSTGDAEPEGPLDVTGGLVYGDREGQPANLLNPFVD